MVDEVESTQDVVRRWIAEGRPHGAALRARRQTAGRGRLGRRWEAEPDAALLLSVLLRPTLPAARLGLLALAGALAVREAAGVPLGVKWPNDLLAPDGRKVAGLLAEAEHHRGQVAVILGVGVNVRGVPGGVPGASLDELGGDGDVDRLAERVVAALRRWCERLAWDPEGVRAAWRAASVTLGRVVQVGEVRGEAVGIDEDGALLLRDVAGVVRRAVAGDVTG